MQGLLEFKSIASGHIKDVSTENRTVTGYFSAFGNVDFDRDIIEKGAFAKSINDRLKDIFYLYQHDWSKPLDRGAKSLKLYEDDFGLAFEATLPDTSYGNDLRVLYESGIVGEHSIGFQTIKSEDRDGVRVIKEVKLYEGSAVTLGANSNTPLTGMKSRYETIDDINAEIKKLAKVFRNANISDDLGIQLEFALKQLQLESFELGKKSTQKDKEPQDNSTQKSDEPEVINKLLTNFNL